MGLSINLQYKPCTLKYELNTGPYQCILQIIFEKSSLCDQNKMENEK